MNSAPDPRLPAAYSALESEARLIGFDLSSELLTGMLLRTLAASKPGGKLLEIGTGVGIGTCWLLDGMDAQARLTTVDQDARVSGIAQKHLGTDQRLTFLIGDAEAFLKRAQPGQYDLIFADTFPGKYLLLDEALGLLKPGGIYVVDDLLPQTTWIEGQQANVDRLVAALEARADLQTVRLDWASGLMVCTKL